MKKRQAIHGLAMVSLVIVATMSIIGSSNVRRVPQAHLEPVVMPFVALLIWSLPLWKIWKRPHKWGLGVGIFLIAVIVFQTYLWHLAIAKHRQAELGIAATTPGFVVHEIPLAVQQCPACCCAGGIRMRL